MKLCYFLEVVNFNAILVCLSVCCSVTLQEYETDINGHHFVKFYVDFVLGNFTLQIYSLFLYGWWRIFGSMQGTPTLLTIITVKNYNITTRTVAAIELQKIKVAPTTCD